MPDICVIHVMSSPGKILLIILIKNILSSSMDYFLICKLSVSKKMWLKNKKKFNKTELSLDAIQFRALPTQISKNKIFPGWMFEPPCRKMKCT